MRRSNPVLPKTLRPRWETPDPPGVTGSFGHEVIRWAEANLHLALSRWQRYVLVKMLRHDARDQLIHRTALFSTARQCGKSVIVRAFFGWLLAEGRLRYPFTDWSDIRAAAHDGKQARIIYRSVHDDLKRIPALTERKQRTSHDERAPIPTVRLSRWLGIETDTLSFDTLTGEAGSARGLSIGALAFDEVLTQRDWQMWEAVKPTQMAQTSPLLILTSTAGMADSVVLRSYYDRLLRIAAGAEAPDPSFFGVWWQSESADAGLDWRQIAQANPALRDGRLSRLGIADEYRTFPTDSWKRERLNHFVDSRVESAFNVHVWAALRTAEPLAGLAGPYVIGVDVQPGWERATVAVGGVRADGRVGVELYRDLRDVTAEAVIAAVESFPDIALVQAIVYDSQAGGASAFERHADATASPWQALKPSEVVAACMDVTEMILSGRLAVDDPLLDSQIPHTGRRPVGVEGAFRFSRHASDGAIDAVMAMTFAAHGIVSVPGMPRIT